MFVSVVAMLLVLACQSGAPKEKGDGPALPEVFGVTAAEDRDDSPNVVEVHLEASATDVAWLDDLRTRAWAYNGQVPGPLIQARVGDTLRVVFTNDLPEATTIHWHGLRIDDEMDGVPAIQEPIQPGETFTYEFVLPDAGSYWYHPHVRGHEQIERGLHGPLIVHEAVPPAVDQERFFVLDDVQLNSDGRFSSFSTGGMNGMHGRHGNYLLVNGSTEPVTDTIQPGAVERWRIVNTANARLMWVNVKGANWRIVGVDGGLIDEPYTAENVRLPVGRRFDLEVIPKDGADQVELQILIPNGGFGFDRFPMYTATIEGDALDTEVPEWTPVPLPPMESIQQDVDVVLDADTSGRSMAWVINGTAYDESEPLPIQANLPTIIRLEETSGAGHPFHLHGQFFEVLSVDGEPFDVPGPLDTVWINGFEEMELYTTFDNPGLWMAHCHILEHAELGMMTSFDVQE